MPTDKWERILRIDLVSTYVPRPNGSVLEPHAILLQVSHTFFDASRSYAQDHDPAPTDSLASYVFAKDSPLFDGLDEEIERQARDNTELAPPNARWKAKALGRSFSGWTGADLEDVALKWWGFERDTIGPDGMVTSGRYHEVVDHLAGLVKSSAGAGNIGLDERVDRVQWNSEEGTPKSTCRLEAL
jgi:hypothetical protein